MSPVWDDLNARAHGLSTHFLTRAQLDALSREPDLPALATALRRHGVLTGAVTEVPRPAELELAIRRWAASVLRILARWAGSRSLALPLVFDDEDRRSLCAILRGAVQRIPAERRIGGLIPTPSLPERALEELGHTLSISAASALLTAWQHPFAAALAPLSGTSQPDLFAIETALSQALAARATEAASKSGSAALRATVREAIDLENARTAVVLASAGRDVAAGTQFLPGGTRLHRATFQEAAATSDPQAARARIAAEFAGTVFAPLFIGPIDDPGTFDDKMLRLRLHELTRRVRRAPLGPLPLIWFALRLRAQLLDLQRIVWTVALGAPRQPLAAMLVTEAA